MFYDRSQGSCPPLPTSHSMHVVFQEAIRNVMLLDGYRFHARVYLFVSSYHPMRVMLYDDALVFTALKRESDSPGTF